MSPIAGAVLVWLGSQAPTPADRAALEAWSREHRVALESPTEQAPAVDDGLLVAGCEHALEQARDELTAGDAEAAQRTLRGLEQVLRDHSELWQAGWLLAERWRLEGRVARALHADPTPWDERADAIEGAGARAVAYGDSPARIGVGSASPARIGVGSATVTVELRLNGATGARGYWDGAPVEGSTVTTAPGEHHLLVVRARGHARVWSGFVSVLHSAPIDLWIAPAPPCSSADLAAVEWRGARPAALGDVRCRSWVAARAGSEVSSWEIARCAGPHCDPPITVGNAVSRNLDAARSTSSSAEPSARTHAWRAWAVGFAALAATTSLVLWGAGAFEQRAPAPRVVVDTSGL